MKHIVRPQYKNWCEKMALLVQVRFHLKSKTHVRHSRTTEHIAYIAQGVEENPALLIPRRVLEFSNPLTSLHHIFHKNLDLTAYNVQLTQDLQPVEYQLKSMEMIRIFIEKSSS